MIRYHTIKEELYSEAVGHYSAFGILVQDSGHPSQYIPDIFLQEEQADAFVEQINALQLSPVHLMDVIMDTLGV